MMRGDEGFQSTSLASMADGDLVAFRHRLWTVISVTVRPIRTHTEEEQNVPGYDEALAAGKAKMSESWRIAREGGWFVGLSTSLTSAWVDVEIARAGEIITFNHMFDTHACPKLVQAHHATCGHCGELWPCTDEDARRTAIHVTYVLDNLCDGCDTALGYGAQIRIPIMGGVYRKYHYAKRHTKCRAAANRTAIEAGGTITSEYGWARFIPAPSVQADQ